MEPILAATALATASSEAITSDSHLWEILLTLATVALVIVSVVVVYATQRLTSATLRVANIEMGKVASGAVTEMGRVADNAIDSIHEHEAPKA
jgi:hypothetical protein